MIERSPETHSPETLSPEALAWDEIWTDLGPFFVAATARGVCYVSWRAQGAEKGLARWAALHAPGAAIERRPGELREVARELRQYARGERRAFAVTLDLRGSDFQRRVWRELRRIPFGSTRTYAEIAKRIDSPGAARAVGSANSKNPVPIFIPCHRVVASQGLGGFSGGIDLKMRLLRHEGAALALA